jgi:hypothetical protein
MSHNHLIKLNILNPISSIFITKTLMFLAALSAWVNSQLILAVVLFVLALSFDRIAVILNLVKVNKIKLTLVIFANGQVRLESSDQDTIEGFLGAQQWCAGHVGILQLIIGNKTRRLVALSTQQNKPDDFRRLKMWLRQDFDRDTKGLQVFGKWPVLRD